MKLSSTLFFARNKLERNFRNHVRNSSQSSTVTFLFFPQESQEIAMLNEVYKERFPKATAQMEEKLSNFIQDLEQVMQPRTNGLLSLSSVYIKFLSTYFEFTDDAFSFGIGRSRRSSFLRFTTSIVANSVSSKEAESNRWLLSLAFSPGPRFLRLYTGARLYHKFPSDSRNVLQKSRENKVTTEFFYELSQKLAMLLNEVRERSPSSSHVISDQIRCAAGVRNGLVIAVYVEY